MIAVVVTARKRWCFPIASCRLMSEERGNKDEFIFSCVPDLRVRDESRAPCSIKLPKIAFVCCVADQSLSILFFCDQGSSLNFLNDKHSLRVYPTRENRLQF